MFLRSLRRSTRKRSTTTAPPTEAERLLRIYQATHADVRELLDDVREPSHRAAA